MTGRKIAKRLTLLFRVAFPGTVGFGAPAAATGKPKPVPEGFRQRYEPVTDPTLYVGPETCKTCHEDIFKNFEITPDFVTTLENQRGPERQGCEACHGPGKEHIESGGDKTKIFTFKGVSAAGSSARRKKG